VDPFAETTSGRYWVNHNWLLDAISFVLYRAAGGSGLILAKAALALVLALLLLRLGRVRELGWHQLVGALLALLTIGPRLGLQPAVVSHVMFAAVWLFLERPLRQPREPDAAPRFAQFWPVLVLMWLWANLDGWFLLGLLLIALTAAGEAIRMARQARRLSSLQPLGFVFLA